MIFTLRFYSLETAPSPSTLAPTPSPVDPNTVYELENYRPLIWPWYISWCNVPVYFNLIVKNDIQVKELWVQFRSNVIEEATCSVSVYWHNSWVGNIGSLSFENIYTNTFTKITTNNGATVSIMTLQL